MEEIKFKPVTVGINFPAYESKDAVCFDLRAMEDVLIKPGECEQIRTGLSFEPPPGYAIFLFPRSGISAKTPLRFANSVGIIDPDYRGEVIVLLENMKQKNFQGHVVPQYTLIDGEVIDGDYQYGYLPVGTYLIKRGDRIAQALAMKIEQFKLVRAKELSKTERGTGGLGSTGVK